MKYPRIILAGVHSRVGKTTLSMGLILAMKKMGLNVQPFKAGPDYIDPSYHSLVSGRQSRNLDTWMLSSDAVLELFERQARSCDVSVVEGVMGLYDGLQDSEEGSTAHLAKILKSPVILVVDASSMSRSSAALVLGYKEFDKDIDIRGIILNNIGSPSHYMSVKNAIEKNTRLPVLGFLPRDKTLILPERHLGLIPTDETALLDDFCEKLLGLIEKNIDVEKIVGITQDAGDLPEFEKTIFIGESVRDKVTIAIAKDAAFNFYYQDNLDILQHYGALLATFSPLRDKTLPSDADGLYIGGGFPELFASQLSKNIDLRDEIYKLAEFGMPVYAECGGLMYLVKDLTDFEDRNFSMVGIFDASVRMGDRLAALGYVDIEAAKDNILSDKGTRVRGHLFHWSRVDALSERENLAYKVKKNEENFADGFVKWNVLASYSHLHFGSDVKFAKNFVMSCRDAKEALIDDQNK